MDYPGHLVALGLTLATAAVVLVAFHAGPLQTPQRNRYCRLLAALHYAAILLVLVILWNPSAWREEETFGKNTVLAVFDTSESMSVADDGRQSRLDRSLSRFAECFDKPDADGPQYRVYGFDERVYHCGSADLLRRWGLRSNLHEAVSLTADCLTRDAQSPTRDEPTGLVIFTDGRADDRDPRRYLPALREDLPILIVGVGARSPRPDLAVETLLSPAAVWVDTTYDVGVVVSAAGVPNAPVTLELLCDNEIVGKRQIDREAFKADGTGPAQATLRFTVPAQGLGVHLLTARVPPGRGEINLGNNARTTSVEVMQERPLRVLLYSQWANFNIGKIRQVLSRDKHIRLDLGFDVIKNKPLSDRATRATGYVTLAEFHTRQDEYDVIIDGSSYIGFPGDDFKEKTSYDFFAKRGGAMILLPGETVHTLATDSQERGLSTLPVLFARQEQGAFPTMAVSSPARVWPPQRDAIKLSFEAEIAYVFDPSVFAEPQYRVSPYYGIAATKPAATTLAMVGDTPIVSVHRVGRGRVCLLNISKLFTLYREDRQGGALSELMCGLVAYLGRTPSQGANVELFAEWVAEDPRRVQFNAYIMDKSFQPAPGANVLLTVGEQVVSMEPTGRGYYRATLDWGSGQSVVAKAQAELNGSFLGERILATTLPAVRDEMSCVDLDEPFLRSLAERMKARYIHIDDLSEKAAEIFESQRQVGTIEKVTSIWPRWSLLVVLCLLLATGWFIRRAIGLV
ncbi:MAG TPA: VWA domain-containing protein [Sedimentisphaerales bacterium]|nr:VWA domain-containing protein [Sedimentisphaerales bacterium]HQG47735.1 VWA domain-containing protein [Sedimentisphaerales bacterium]